MILFSVKSFVAHSDSASCKCIELCLHSCTYTYVYTCNSAAVTVCIYVYSMSCLVAVELVPVLPFAPSLMPSVQVVTQVSLYIG